MMIMELTELKYLNNIDMLKYLVYFQVCQDNSLHLYTYQIYKAPPHIQQDRYTKSGRTRRPLFVCLFHDFIVLILFSVSCPIRV